MNKLFYKLQVENLVAIELAYINTKHPDFQKEAALVSCLQEEDVYNHQRRMNKRLPIGMSHNQPNAVANSVNDVDQVKTTQYVNTRLEINL